MEKSPIELAVDDLIDDGFTLGTMLVPEQCAEVYDATGTRFHVVIHPGPSYTLERMPEPA